DYTAKLSDFGLAKDGPQGDETHVSTRVMATYGYAAPEYVMTVIGLGLRHLQIVMRDVLCGQGTLASTSAIPLNICATENALFQAALIPVLWRLNRTIKRISAMRNIVQPNARYKDHVLKEKATKTLQTLHWNK
ncbi:hypothetical protein SUGI_0811010, partial [Cryptomeria japonica]